MGLEEGERRGGKGMVVEGECEKYCFFDFPCICLHTKLHQAKTNHEQASSTSLKHDIGVQSRTAVAACLNKTEPLCLCIPAESL